MVKCVVQTPDAPKAVGPYSQAVQCGEWLFLSGQIGLNPETSELARGGIEAETRQVLQNIQAILQAAGASAQHICKTTIFLTDLNSFATVNQIYAAAMVAPLPARSTVQVAALPLGAQVEIEVIAHLAANSENP